MEIKVVVPLRMGMGRPKPFSDSAPEKDIDQPQIQCQQLKPVVGHDQPPQPAVSEGLCHGDFSAFIIATEMMRPVREFVDGLDGLRPAMLWALAMRKIVTGTVNQFFKTEKGNHCWPEILVIKPCQ